MKVTDWVNVYPSPRAGITFHDRAFTEPARLSLAFPPIASGIYAILIPDPLCQPRPFRVIYFGESSNFSSRVTENHEHFGDWVREAGGIANTYVAFCSTPFLREEQRCWVKRELIDRYRPVCNLKGNRPPSYYHPMLGIAK